MNQPAIDWDGEYDKLTKQLREAFVANKIQEFLITYTKLNSLFTTKLQAILDRKDHFTEEHIISADPMMLKKFDEFNNNVQSLMATHEQMKQASKSKKLTDKSKP